jgi:hypothetical protein
MFREVAIAVVALAAIDHFFLDGKYIQSVQAVARSLMHFLIG